MNSRFYLLRLTCTLAISACLASVATPAAAQDLANDANAQYRKAFAALSQRNWPEARQLLLPLWQRSHTWDVASGLGQAEFFLDNYATGATYTAFALANLPPKEKVMTADRLRAALGEMKAAVGTLHVTVSEGGAEILLDDELQGISPLAREVYANPGRHWLQARLANGAQSRQSVVVEAGKSYPVALILEKPLDDTASALLASAPGGTTASSSGSPPVDHDRYRPNWAPVLVTGGLAVAAAAIGAGFAIDASSAKTDGAQALSEAEAEFGNNPCAPSSGGGSEICQTVQSSADRRKTSNTVATASFAISGVFALTAVGSYFLWAKPRAPRVDAWLGPNGGGLHWAGQF